MSTQEISSKVQKLWELRRMAEELAGEIDAPQDSIKAEMTARSVDELARADYLNHLIQSEGVFSMIKEDMQFRRFLTRGKHNVTVEWLLLCFAYNILKLDHKAKTGRLGTHLIIPEKKAA